MKTQNLIKTCCALLFLILCLTACSIEYPLNRKIERDAAGKEIYEWAVEAVSKQLLSPTSAEYPEFQMSFVTDMEEETEYEDGIYHLYSVEAYVDSNNAFGTQVRQYYEVIIGMPIDTENDSGVYYEIIYLE